MEYILIIFFCVLLGGFFAGAETGAISCSRIRMRHLAERGDQRGRIVAELLAAPERLLALTLRDLRSCPRQPCASSASARKSAGTNAGDSRTRCHPRSVAGQFSFDRPISVCYNSPALGRGEVSRQKLAG